jgi:hypothetical protein
MKLNVFISSRNNDRVIINGVPGNTLTEVRQYLKKELESVKLLDKDLFEIHINETFGAVSNTDSYNKCLVEVQESDFVIALYNGAAGWAPRGIDMGICHAELVEALNVSTRKTSIVDISAFFNLIPASANETKLNNLFSEYIKEINTFTNPLKLSKNILSDGFRTELLESIKNVLYKHLEDRIRTANLYFNISGDNKISLNWKKLKYNELDKNITNIIRDLIDKSPYFSTFITTASSIPDNMSVDDAKSFTGRPSQNDQVLINASAKFKKIKQGPIHFVGVFGNATEIQVKNLIGFPDISTMKDDFGLYVWEQNTHVQMVFLTNCKTPDAVRSKFLLFTNWCRSNQEYDNMIKRAQARHHILTAMNYANGIVSNNIPTTKAPKKRVP